MDFLEIERLVQAGQITFDWNGHLRNRVVTPAEVVDDRRYAREYNAENQVLEGAEMVYLMTRFKDHEATLDKEKKKLQRSIERAMRKYTCFDCGERVAMVYDEETHTFTATTPCPYPEGHPAYGPEVTFPTGKLFFGDALFRDRPEEMDPTAKEGAGILWEKSATMSAGKIHVAHGYCGNSCPGVYVHKSKRQIIIGSPAYDPETDEEVDTFFKDNYTRVGSIITGLWWWTIADEKTAEAIVARDGCDLDIHGAAEVLPGRWNINQRYHLEDRSDTSTPTIYAYLQYAGE